MHLGGVAERLAAGDRVALLIYGAHQQYPETGSRDPATPLVTVSGSLQLPLLSENVLASAGPLAGLLTQPPSELCDLVAIPGLCGPPVPGPVLSRDECDAAGFFSPEGPACEAQNFAGVAAGPLAQLASSDFQTRYEQQSLANISEYQARRNQDPYWDSTGNVCASWGRNCQGDPYRYPAVDPWYGTVGEVTPVNFYDAGGARLNGRVWSPANPVPGKTYPAVVIINGSVQAPEPLYWWAAQLLVQNGYLVMTFDPRGQGRSDTATPSGEQGSNANSNVFRSNLIDAIEFFYSSPAQPYPHNLAGRPGPEGDGGLAETTAFNPIHTLFDTERLGIAGHSLGATGVSVVQGEENWTGELLNENPVKVAVAWDNISLGALSGISARPRVPMMGQAGDYYLVPVPYPAPQTDGTATSSQDGPDPQAKSAGYNRWVEEQVPAMQINLRAATHYEWSLLPNFPSSNWRPGLIVAPDGSNIIAEDFGNAVAQYYTLAWFDRWLKLPTETGYLDADERLTGDQLLRDRFSFYFDSQWSFPTRAGVPQSCEDIAAGC